MWDTLISIEIKWFEDTQWMDIERAQALQGINADYMSPSFPCFTTLKTFHIKIVNN